MQQQLRLYLTAPLKRLKNLLANQKSCKQFDTLFQFVCVQILQYNSLIKCLIFGTFLAHCCCCRFGFQFKSENENVMQSKNEQWTILIKHGHLPLVCSCCLLRPLSYFFCTLFWHILALWSWLIKYDVQFFFARPYEKCKKAALVQTWYTHKKNEKLPQKKVRPRRMMSTCTT